MKTKIILTVILVVTSIVGISAQGNRTVKRNIQVNPFTSITVSSGWDVIIRQGNRQSVSIEVSEEILERAIIEVKTEHCMFTTRTAIVHFCFKAYVTSPRKFM